MIDTLQIFREISQQKGPVEAQTTSAGKYNIQDKLSILFIEAQLIKPLDLKSIQILNTTFLPNTESNLDLLLIFLFANQNLGNSFFPYDPNNQEKSFRFCVKILNLSLETIDTKNITNENSFFRQLCIDIEEYSKHDINSQLMQIFSKLNEGLYKDLIGLPGMGTPLILDQQIEGSGIYFQKHFQNEEDSSDKISEILVKNFENEYVTKVVDNFNQYILPKKSIPIELTETQKRGVLLGCLKHLFIITGGPGTGKTTLISWLIYLFNKIYDLNYKSIQLVAPTGRAASQLEEAVKSQLRKIEKNIVEIENKEFLQGKTVHRLLKFNPIKGRYTYDASNPLPAKIVILDETSMLDNQMFCRLIKALSSDTHLVLLGDPNQLPSVNIGSALNEMLNPIITQKNCFTKENFDRIRTIFKTSINKEIINNHFIYLTKNLRSNQNIIQISKNIVEGNFQEALRGHIHIILDQVDSLEELENWSNNLFPTEPDKILSGGILITSGNSNYSQHLNSILDNWSNTYFHDSFNKDGHKRNYFQLINDLTKFSPVLNSDPFGILNTSSPFHRIICDLFEFQNKFQCMTVLRQGPFGSQFINQYFLSKIKDRLKLSSQFENISGMPIIIDSNDYKLGLYNGDMGILIKLKNIYYGVFNSGQEFKFFPDYTLPPHSPAFSITIHKAQGSEYDHTLILFPDRDTPLMTREILYTGITRSKLSFTTFCSLKALEKTVKRKIDRLSNIAKKINSKFK